ncbi:hypothetical protein [Brevundimonas sp.]|jgi:hypothetical protein|uniref:hypothetical protein n=1 Tax=Brevundimonas sp. TaxID=1871086 RepID=UPI0037C1623C
MSLTRRFDVFADYFQFYVCDAAYTTDTASLWVPETVDRMLATGPDLLGVGTARNMLVPVELQVLDREPSPDPDDWDGMLDCGLSLHSGALIVFGCTEEPAEAERIPVPAGDYGARVSCAGLDTLSEDGLDGDDRYRIQLWPGGVRPVMVVKPLG